MLLFIIHAFLVFYCVLPYVSSFLHSLNHFFEFILLLFFYYFYEKILECYSRDINSRDIFYFDVSILYFVKIF